MKRFAALNFKWLFFLLPVAVDDGVQAVSYGQDGTVRERLPDGLLDELVRVVVN